MTKESTVTKFSIKIDHELPRIPELDINPTGQGNVFILLRSRQSFRFVSFCLMPVAPS